MQIKQYSTYHILLRNACKNTPNMQTATKYQDFLTSAKVLVEELKSKGV